MDLHGEIDGLAAEIERAIAENERTLNDYERRDTADGDREESRGREIPVEELFT
jgi:hypothetical protein